MNRKTLVATALALGLSTVGGVATVEGRKVEAGDRSVKGCVAAPMDGGTDCLRQVPRTRFQRALSEREARYFGASNSFPAREAVGACEPMPPTSCSGGE